MNKISFKKQKMEDKILNEINTIFRRHLSDFRLKFVTITKVELNADFSQSHVYWDIYDSTKIADAKQAINKAKGRVRSLLSNVLKIRHIPQIHFIHDSQFESEKKITDILSLEAESGRYTGLDQ